MSGGMEHPRVTPVPGRSTIVIDGQALVMAKGRPSECNKFDDLADRFLKAFLVFGKHYDRIDDAFDRYREAIFRFHGPQAVIRSLSLLGIARKLPERDLHITKRYWKVLKMETWMTRLRSP